METHPIIDSRTEDDIVEQVQALLRVYVPGWNTGDSSINQPVDLSAALIRIFGRYASLIIKRLNQAPEKNFLAFLDLLGTTRLPPMPSRVPLTFMLSKGSIFDTVVPAGTQVAAPPKEGEKELIIFESERELVATSASLKSLFVQDPEKDQYNALSDILITPKSMGVPAFEGNCLHKHILYISSDLFGLAHIETVTLNFVLNQGFSGNPQPSLIWEFWNGLRWSEQTPSIDPSGSFLVIFNFSDNSVVVPLYPVNSVESHWLRCRLATPIAASEDAEAGMLSPNALPEIESISLGVYTTASSLLPTCAFTNSIPVDLSKDFFPFGEKPRFGDTLYLANVEAFSRKDTSVTLHVDLSESITPQTDGNVILNWEYWTGTDWEILETSIVTDDDTTDPSPSSTNPAKANTFTATGAFKFGFLSQPMPTTVNGVTNYWIRARIISGNYGQEAYYDPIYGDSEHPDKITGYQLIPATFAPPSIKKITIGFSLTYSNQTPDKVLTYNDFTYQQQSPDDFFQPFQPTEDTDPSLYLGFVLPHGREKFPNHTLSLYFDLVDVHCGHPADEPSATTPPRLFWEYWNGSDWIKLVVRDETEALTHSGLVEFLPPNDFEICKKFNLEQYWLRVRWESGNYKFLPRLCTIFPNTTTAIQAMTIENEILGSSDGQPNQIFQTVRAPVLREPILQIREPNQPSDNEQGTVGLLDDDMKATVSGEMWTTWHSVDDFYTSGPRDRHYLIDPLTGQIRFGDGIYGRIPPQGKGNIRMKQYRIGGGVRGNCEANTVTQLKTTIPYIDKVINHKSAAGGADAEEMDVLIARAPRMIRHRNRAVTFEDYEDLAKLASPEVIRVKCVRLYDLSVDPDMANQLPGTVSVVIVPRSTDPRPQVSLELAEHVQAYLVAHSVPTATVVVVGPDYLAVNVVVEIALTSLEASSDVDVNVESALKKFLHPLTGGQDGNGWDFGRLPQKSDLFSLLEVIPGVDHIRGLNLTLISDRGEDADINKMRCFLIYAGTISITTVYLG